LKKNYEIKCKLSDAKLKYIRSLLQNYNHTFQNQTDIYYKVKTGRLKLRIINNREGNLIFYERGEKTNKRISKYIISKTKDFKELDNILRKQFQVLVTVDKRRDIFIKKNTRIHLDKVRGLGKFLEIEIIYENFLKAKSQMKGLISLLKLDETNFIKESYSDLLINRR
jgi:predicted adenylyl cyclase CyaB